MTTKAKPKAKAKAKAGATALPAWGHVHSFPVHMLNPAEMRVHPLAELFPEMGDDDFAAFRESVLEHGISDPVWVDDQLRVADGRHRLRAAQALGVKTIPARKLSDRFLSSEAEIRDFVVAQNLHRRHLTESQRAMVAASLVTAKHGGKRPAKGQGENSAVGGGGEKTIAQASADLKVSTFSTKAGKRVLE
jgi:hypothetical protein